MTTLAERIIQDSEDSIIKAIQNGADVNELDAYGFRPLIQAIIKKKYKVLLELLNNGADIEQQDILGKTPLQWACDRNELDFVSILLEHGANPNHHSIDGQPLLVNPILRQQLEIVDLLHKYGANNEFAQDFISAKLLGHRFELNGETDIVSTKGSFIPLSYEGFYLEFSTSLLYRSLHNYDTSIQGQKFRAYHGKIKKILTAMHNAAQLAAIAHHKDKEPFKQTINSILQQDLLLLPSAYAGHAITFIKYRNLWVKCDRGVSHLADTVVVYNIGNPYMVNEELCNKILFEPKDKDFIFHELKNILRLTPLATLPTRQQLTGNCSWANVETSIPAMLYMLSINVKSHTNDENNILVKDIYRFYNSWVDWDKDSALDEAIEDFNQANNLPRQISKAIILGNIITQRLNHNSRTDVKRAEKILKVLASPNFEFILRNHLAVFNNPRAGRTGKNIIKLFKKCGLDLRRLRLKHYVKSTQHNVESDNIRMTTALHVAALNGDIASIHYLLEKQKVDVDYCDRTGSTPLMYAAWKGHLEAVKVLVNEYNANPQIKNLKGGTAARYAKFANFPEICELL